jgi:hypothetical protein
MSNYVIVKMITEQTPYLKMVKMMFIETTVIKVITIVTLVVKVYIYMVYATEHIHSVVVTNCILQLAIYF